MGCLAISVFVYVWVCWSIPEIDGRVLDELGVAPVGVAAAGTGDSVAADVGAAFSSSRIVSRISFLISSLSTLAAVAGPADDVGVNMAHW